MPADPTPAPNPEDRFRREGVRHQLRARRGRVISVERPASVMIRVRLGGDDLSDFASTGPSDHMRVQFPEPAVAARNVEATMVTRDFTPQRVVRSATGVEVDIDFFDHATSGPAITWAQAVTVGDEVVVAGPRGSRGAPQEAGRTLLVVDETALPAASRFAREVPASTVVDVVAFVHDDGAWASEYLAEASDRDDVTVHLVTAPPADGTLIEAVAAAGGIDSSTFVFAAGEASALLPLRRHLRGVLQLPREQVAISGYWRRGVVAFDHHSPVDPEDPD